jgi:hypothetical protein
MVTMHGASQQIWMTDVRFGSKADVTLLNFDVRFTPESGHPPARDGGLSGVTLPITLRIDFLHRRRQLQHALIDQILKL